MLTALDERAVEILAKIDLLLETVTPDARDLRRARAELTRLRNRRHDLTLHQIDEQMAVYRGRATVLDARHADRLARLQKASEDAVTTTRLQEQLDMRRQILARYEEIHEQMRIDRELNRQMVASLYQISDVTPPITPAGPRSILILAIAAMVGFMLGIVLALIRGVMDTRLRSPQDVLRSVALPVVATIPTSR